MLHKIGQRSQVDGRDRVPKCVASFQPWAETTSRLVEKRLAMEFLIKMVPRREEIKTQLMGRDADIGKSGRILSRILLIHSGHIVVARLLVCQALFTVDDQEADVIVDGAHV